MIYYSKVTEKMNSSHSYVSQEDAEAKAKALDDNGFSYYTDIARCVDCGWCKDCTDVGETK